MRIYSEKELEELGYKEIRPGVFAKENTPTPPNKKAKKKKIPEQYAKLKGGKYRVGEKIYRFRSEWEYVFACYLEFLKKVNKIKNWEFESKRFEFPVKRGCTSYLPDFYVLGNDDAHCWIEVKGFLDQKGATKLKRFAKYYPEEPLKVIRQDRIQEIRESGILGNIL